MSFNICQSISRNGQQNVANHTIWDRIIDFDQSNTEKADLKIKSKAVNN